MRPGPYQIRESPDDTQEYHECDKQPQDMHRLRSRVFLAEVSGPALLAHAESIGAVALVLALSVAGTVVSSSDLYINALVVGGHLVFPDPLQGAHIAGDARGEGEDLALQALLCTTGEPPGAVS